MNHSTVTTTLSAPLQKEAEELLRQRLQEASLEAITEMTTNFPESYTDYLKHGSQTQEDEPWFTGALHSAIMPDRSICPNTLNEGVRRQALSNVTHYHIDGASIELRKTLIERGYIYCYVDIAQEDEDPEEVALEAAEVTGYGIAKLLNIDLHNYVASHWPRTSATPKAQQ